MSDRHLTFISARATRVLAISNICLHLGICLARGVAISSVLTVKTTYTAHTPHWAAGCLLLRKPLVAFLHMNSQLTGLQMLNPSLVNARDARVRDLVTAEPRTLGMPMS